jgi:monothiol glutaredoxin
MRDSLSEFLSEETMRSILTEKVRGTGEERGEAVLERIKTYLASSPVVLFMKGSPDFPQCGFSAQVVSALRQFEAGFVHVNILEDPELRQALKTYSDWPTFPQLYVKGELVGGCDIVLEMHRSGELRRILQNAAAVPSTAGAPIDGW